MKKLFSFVCILFLGVISSACVNMFAVSELNQIAKEYLDEGNVQAAISRLESSVDLDGEIYESRYNLAVSYLRTDNCKGAQEQIEVALTLRSNEPAALYTAGVAYTCVATEIYEKKDKDGNIEFIKYDDLQKDYVAALDYIKYLELANKNFEKYVELMPNADDTKDVIAQIGYNKENIASHKTKYNVN